MKLKFFAPIIGVALCGSALAQHSGGFYLLKNAESGKLVCSQAAPSTEWVRQAGPFRDPKCQIVEKPEPARTDLPANPLDLTPKK